MERSRVLRFFDIVEKLVDEPEEKTAETLSREVFAFLESDAPQIEKLKLEMSLLGYAQARGMSFPQDAAPVEAPEP